MRRAGRALRAVALALLLAGCGTTERLATRINALVSSQEGISYTVDLEGPDLGAGLAAELRQVLDTARSDLPPPPNRVVLLHRARADLERLKKLLRALGYYGAHASVSLEQTNERPVAEPSSVPEENGLPSTVAGPRYRVVFDVRVGPRYRFGRRRIRIVGADFGFRPPSPGRIGLKDGEPAEAEKILAAEARLLRTAREQGHAFARLGKRRVVVDHRTRKVEVELAIEPGPVVRIGRVVFEGARGVHESYLRRRIRLREGERFDPRRIEEARRLLVETGLFTSVQTEISRVPGADRTITLRFRVVPRKPRSIGGAVGIHSDRGPGGRAFFVYRNLFGEGESLRVEARGNRNESGADAEFRIPDIFLPGRDLVSGLRYRDQTSEAFRSRSLEARSGLDQRLTPRLSLSGFVRYRFADIRDKTADGKERNGRFRQLSLPVELEWDGSDNRFDPTRGTRLNLALEPFLEVDDPGTRFVRARYRQSVYFHLQRKPRIVLALRAAVGTILGVDRVDIPADERFFSGGGGSIRGIPFQKAGPLDSNNNPLGGRSLLEGSIELRIRPFRKLGFAVFVDGGSAFTSIIPDLQEETPRYGGGIGIRYATPIGPLRLDFAVPFKRNPAVDDPLQLYLSLGQAF